MNDLYVFSRGNDLAITRHPNGANLPRVGWSRYKTITEADLGEYLENSLGSKKLIDNDGYIVAPTKLCD